MLELEQVGNASAFGRPAHVRDFVNAFDVHAAHARKKHQVVVRAGREKVLDEIFVLLTTAAFASRHADDALATAALGAVGADISTLHQPAMGERDDDALVGDEIFDCDFAFFGHEFRQPRRRILFSDREQLALDDGQHAGFLGKHIEQIFDARQQIAILSLDLVDFQAR